MEPAVVAVDLRRSRLRVPLLAVVATVFLLGVVADVVWVPLMAHHPLVLAWISGRLGHLLLAATRAAFWPFAVAMAVRCLVSGVSSFAWGRMEGEARFEWLAAASGLFARPERVVPVLGRIGVPLVVVFPTIPVSAALGATGAPAAVFGTALVAGAAMRVALATAASRLLGHQLSSVVEALSNRQWIFVAAGAALVAWHFVRVRWRSGRCRGTSTVRRSYRPAPPGPGRARPLPCAGGRAGRSSTRRRPGG